jgi:hypothetical protein
MPNRGEDLIPKQNGVCEWRKYVVIHKNESQQTRMNLTHKPPDQSSLEQTKQSTLSSMLSTSVDTQL